MAGEGFKRKLTAILSADVEGYSRLMDDDEEATVRTLTAYRNVITDLVQQFRGRIVDAPGDNILAEFTSVVDAVNCAVEIQRELAERNAELEYKRKMEFRIGVNLGDVIEEEGRIYGDGVNIAARVEAMAEAGGICITGRAYDQVANKLGLGYEHLGEHKVKNISTPIRVYRVLSHPGAAAHRVIQAQRVVRHKWRLIAVSLSVILILAIAASKKAITLNPNSAEAYFELGCALYWSSKPAEAINYVKKAIRLNPMPPTIYIHRLGLCYADLDRFEEALKYFKKAIGISPDFLWAHVGLAITYISMGREREAQEAALKVLSIDPDFSVNALEKADPRKDRERVKRRCEAARKAGLPD